MTQSELNLREKISVLDQLLCHRNILTSEILSFFGKSHQLMNSELTFVTLTFSPEKIDKKSLYHENFTRSFIKMLQLLDCSYVFTRQEGRQKSTEEVGYWNTLLAYYGDNPPKRDFSNTHFHGIVETGRSLDLFLHSWEKGLGNYDAKRVIKNMPKAVYYLLHEDGITDDLRIFTSRLGDSFLETLEGIRLRDNKILKKYDDEKRKYGKIKMDLSLLAQKNRREFIDNA